MAIYNAVPPPPDNPSPPSGAPHQQHHQYQHQHTISTASTATVDIEAWTISALESLSVSPIARGTGTPLSIPIDELAQRKKIAVATPDGQGRIADDHPAGAGRTLPPRRPPSARDSLHKREAVLKGAEGSRARRRWENARLMDVPNVVPPLPSDWQVHPTHPVHAVPYELAQYWEAGIRQRVEDNRMSAIRRKQDLAKAKGSAVGTEAGQVPRELRATAKKTPAVKSWVRVLEEPVRRFLESAKAEEDDKTEEDSEEMIDSEDEEIVFVGRNVGRESTKKATRNVGRQTVESGVVFDALGDDASGAFKRYLTHSISDYYGLDSQSITVGKPPKRIVYVGIKELRNAPKLKVRGSLPRPMWELF